MTEQSSRDQRYSFPGAGAVPGEDDGQVAPDEAMASPDEAAGTAQQLDPGGYPHEPSPDAPRVPADAGEAEDEEQDLPQPEVPAGPGAHNAQTDRDQGAR